MYDTSHSLWILWTQSPVNCAVKLPINETEGGQEQIGSFWQDFDRDINVRDCLTRKNQGSELGLIRKLQ